MNDQNGQTFVEQLNLNLPMQLPQKFRLMCLNILSKYSKMTTFSKSFKNFIQNFSISFSITTKNA